MAAEYGVNGKIHVFRPEEGGLDVPSAARMFEQEEELAAIAAVLGGSLQGTAANFATRFFKILGAAGLHRLDGGINQALLSSRNDGAKIDNGTHTPTGLVANQWNGPFTVTFTAGAGFSSSTSLLRKTVVLLDPTANNNDLLVALLVTDSVTATQFQYWLWPGTSTTGITVDWFAAQENT